MNSWLTRNFVLIAAITLLNANFVQADSTQADGRFSVTVGSKDQLVIFGPSGEKVGEFNPPAISQQVKVGAATMLVSYGRDANDLWTAILIPSSGTTQLNFTVLDNKIDAEKGATVTVTFSKDLKKITVDPGYIGLVKVNDTAVTTSVTVNSRGIVAPAASPAITSAGTPTTQTPATALDNSSTKVDTSSNAVAPTIPLLKNIIYWAEPVTPAAPQQLPAIASDEMKLLEVQGGVTLILPNTSNEVTATNGQVIPNGTEIKTTKNGSVAILLGGVNSTRVLPESDVILNQGLASNKRTTLIDLKGGIVCPNVGRREGETQDFKVKTAGGVAAAQGTVYMVKAEGNLIFVATLVGSVNVTDANGNFIGTSTPSQPGVPGIINSDHNADKHKNNAILGSILIIIKSFNSKINYLESLPPDSLTPEQRSWLSHAPKLAQELADILNDDLRQYGFQGEPDLGGAQGGPGGPGTPIPPAPPGPPPGPGPIIVNPNDPNQPTTPA